MGGVGPPTSRGPTVRVSKGTSHTSKVSPLCKMTTPKEARKPSWLLYLLLATVIGILICGSVILYLTLLKPTVHEEHVTEYNFTTAATTTVTTERPTVTESTVEVTTTTTAATTTTTTTEKTEEIAVPINVEEVLQKSGENDEIVKKCQDIATQPNVCAPQLDIVKPSLDKFDPLHYGINFTIRDFRKPVYEGSLSLFGRVKIDTNVIALNAGKLHNVDDKNRVFVAGCELDRPICVRSIIHDAKEETIYVVLAENLTTGENFRIDFKNFVAADIAPHVYKQLPTGKWRVPTMLGTTFGENTTRNLFPGLDLPSKKASFSVCLTQFGQLSARTNAELSNGTTDQICFEKSVPITMQQFSLVATEQTEKLVFNSTTIDGTQLPNIEIISNTNRNFKPEQNEWIRNETAEVAVLLSKWTRFPYPLEKLTIVVAPVFNGHSALGVVTLPAQAVAHSKHVSSHEILEHGIISQWLEGIVTTTDKCFEKSLTTYIEWKINEMTQIVKKSRKSEIQKIRPRNLNETSDSRILRTPVIRDNNCASKLVEVFYTLDETFGNDTVVGMMRQIFDKFAFASAGVEEWAEAAEVTTGKNESAQILREWFSRQNRPVLHATVTSHTVQFRQLTPDVWTVPVEVAGSNGIELHNINEANQTIQFESLDYVMVDPARKSNAFVVYDADTYLRLIRCYSDSTKCPSKEVGQIFSDFGAALLANILPTPLKQDYTKWKSVFKFIAQQNLVEGVAACCVEHAIREMRKCSYWDVQDVCTKIEMNTVLAAIQ